MGGGAAPGQIQDAGPLQHSAGACDRNKVECCVSRGVGECGSAAPWQVQRLGGRQQSVVVCDGNPIGCGAVCGGGEGGGAVSWRIQRARLRQRGAGVSDRKTHTDASLLAKLPRTERCMEEFNGQVLAYTSRALAAEAQSVAALSAALAWVAERWLAEFNALGFAKAAWAFVTGARSCCIGREAGGCGRVAPRPVQHGGARHHIVGMCDGSTIDSGAFRKFDEGIGALF